MMTNSKMVLTAGLMMSALWVARADALVCGDVISDEQTLVADLACPAHDPALTINGGVLDMNGHTLSGFNGVGVLLTGSGSVLQNGRLDGFDVSASSIVRLAGTGSHTVKNVVITRGTPFSFGFDVMLGSDRNSLTNAHAVDFVFSTGFAINSSKNTLVGCTAVRNGFSSFVISGSGNTLKNCTAVDYGDDGFNLSGGGHKLVRVRAMGGNYGYRDGGSGGNKYTSAIASGQSSAAFSFLNSTEGNKLKDCHADGSNVGFSLDGNAHSVSKSSATNSTGNGMTVMGFGVNLSQVTVSGNGDEGIRVDPTAAGVTIKKSTIGGNGQSGIHNAGATELTVSGNVVFGNGSPDLDDDVVLCSGNNWSANVFGTRSQTCIQ